MIRGIEKMALTNNFTAIGNAICSKTSNYAALLSQTSDMVITAG